MPPDKELYAVMSSKIAGDWAEYRAACRYLASVAYLLALLSWLLLQSLTAADTPSGNSFGSCEACMDLVVKHVIFPFHPPTPLPPLKPLELKHALAITANIQQATATHRRRAAEARQQLLRFRAQ